jgi:hypothetical protein
MAVKIVATHTCDVCGDKINDVQAVDATTSALSRGLHVRLVTAGGEGETVENLYTYEEICNRCLGAVQKLFARLAKRHPDRSDKKAARAPRAKAVRTPKASSAGELSVAAATDGAPKKKRGRPRKVVNTAPINDDAVEAAEPETHISNGAIDAAHPF